MTWATTKGAEGAPAAYKATRKDWLKAGAEFMDKDVLYLLGAVPPVWKPSLRASSNPILSAPT